MDKFTEIVTKVNDFVWGPVMLVFLVGTGIFLTLRLRFLPWRNLGSSLKKLFSKESRKKDGEGDISPFSALMTALAATVGTVTASMMNSMRYGIARGVFSNEAGLGSAAISAASATSDHHVKQGFINMCGTFIDTIIVCTITGLAIASSGVLGTTNADGKLLEGAELTIAAFETALGKAGAVFVTISIILFAFSTILGWEYNGEKALEFLFKKPIFCYIYRVVFSLLTYVGATATLGVVWSFSDIANGLMAIPNLICLIALSGSLAKETKDYHNKLKDEKVKTK